MLFRYSGSIHDPSLRQRGAFCLEFTVESIRIAFRHRDADDPEVGYEAIAEEEPPRKALSAFQGLVAQDESIGLTPMGDMPVSFREFSERVERDLRAALERVLGLLRWRAGGEGPWLPSVGGTMSWSFSENRWYDFPHPARTMTIVVSETRSVAAGELQRLIDEGLSEPFAYELLREAAALENSNPRSSLLIAMAALEVAVKHYIAARVPQADWLVNELQAPDIIKMLSGYLSTLESPAGAPEGASRFEPLSDELLELLRRRRDQRNAIAHSPEAHQRRRPDVATPERATSAVMAVKQVLLRLDVAEGHEWARKYLREPPYGSPPSGRRGKS